MRDSRSRRSVLFVALASAAISTCGCTSGPPSNNPTPVATASAQPTSGPIITAGPQIPATPTPVVDSCTPPKLPADLGVAAQPVTESNIDLDFTQTYLKHR